MTTTTLANEKTLVREVLPSPGLEKRWWLLFPGTGRKQKVFPQPLWENSANLQVPELPSRVFEGDATT